MKHFVRILSLSPVVILLSLFLTIPVLALPPFPSSFYGTVKVNGANVPDGTVIQALVAGQVHAEAYTQTYQGNSVFALDVAGDDPGTAALEGGREGDTIQFKIGGRIADQTAVWHGGTNIALNLTVASSEPISRPPAIPTPIPTQTEIIVLIRPSFTPSTSARSAFSVTSIPASPIATKPSQPLHAGTTNVQISSTHNAPKIEHEKANRSGSVSPTAVVAIALPVVMVIGYTVWAFHKKKM